METVDNRSFIEKVKDFGRKAKVKAEETCEAAVTAVKDHPVEAFTLVALALPGAFKLANTSIRAKEAKRQQRRDECDYYDPRTGEHWYTKKPLTANQKLNLEQRYKLGESKGQILRDMKAI